MTTPAGTFIVIEGPSGVGKSTIIAALHERLTSNGDRPVIVVKQPSSSPLGNLTRELTDQLSGHALACLVAADRYQHLTTDISPAVDAGHIVLCDRYVPSSLVLQVLDGVDEQFVDDINAATLPADLYVFLEGDPQQSRTRSYERGPRDRFHDQHTADVEAERYEQVAERLRQLGRKVARVNTTDRTVTALVDEIEQYIRRNG